ncbi:MAG: hypothetical protein Q9162_005484 [Coniocarpon cinnabarinum]
MLRSILFTVLVTSLNTLLSLSALATAQSTSNSPDALINCLTQASIPFISPTSPNYESQIQSWNTRFNYQPAAIATPNSTNQLSATLQCASTTGTRTQPKSGGHGYAAFSSGGEDGSLVISLQQFDDVDVDDNGVAKVGAGQRLGDMALALLEKGRAMPHGSCPGVGIGGHASHGGYGYASRAWGLTLDTIEGLDVVLVNGSILHVNDTQQGELFWGLRGAADSLGVISNFYFKTFEAPQASVYFSYAFCPGVYNGTGAIAAQIMQHLQDFALNASVIDSRIGFGVYIDPSSFSLSGLFFGSEEEYAGKIRGELLRGLPQATESVQVLDWRGVLDVLAEGQGDLVQPLGSGYSLSSDFFAKSLMSPQDSPITLEAWTAYFEYITTHGNFGDGASWYSIIDLFGGPGSAISAVSSNSTAWPHRNTLFDFQHYGYVPPATRSTPPSSSSPSTIPPPPSNASIPLPPIDPTFPSSIEPFIQGLNDVIPTQMPGVDFGAYINYVDSSLSAEEAHDVYYGDEVYGRLLALKETVDPEVILWNPQAVGV